MTQIIHYTLHIFLPLAVAMIFGKNQWRKIWLIMLLGMVIDVDHLWANPVFDPQRCSVGFHTLHTWPFIIGYIGLTVWPRTKWIGWGILLHLITDTIDCWMNGHVPILM